MHLLSLGSVLLTLSFLANASPTTKLPDKATTTTTSPSPSPKFTLPYLTLPPVRGPGKCERKCGPQPRCGPIQGYSLCYRWTECMKKCEFGTPKPACVNNDRTWDSVGWTCSNHYDFFPHDCGHYDTPNFNSYRQCCACKDLVC